MEVIHCMNLPVKTKQRAIVSLLYLGFIMVALYALYVVGNRIQTRALPSGSIQISTEYSKYLVGDEVKFTITNNYNGAIYFDIQCPDEPLEVYRLENEVWKQIHDKRNKNSCKKIDRSIKIPGNSSVTSSFKPWEDLFAKAGTYRIVAYVDYYGSLPYTDFEIIEKPTIPEIPALIDIPASSSSNSDSSSPTSTTESTSNATQDATTDNSDVEDTTTNTDTGSASKSQTITIQGGGSITVDYTSSTITVKSVNKPSGYSSYELSGNGRSTVDITFKGGEEEMQVKLSIRNGVVTSRTEIDD